MGGKSLKYKVRSLKKSKSGGLDFFISMKNQIGHIFINLRNIAYTRALRRYGERSAFAVYKVELYFYFLPPSLVLFCLYSFINFESRFGFRFGPKEESSKWILIYSAVFLLVSIIVFQIVYRVLIPKTEPLRKLEGEEYKHMNRVLLILVFGPLAILFITLAIVAK